MSDSPYPAGRRALHAMTIAAVLLLSASLPLAAQQQLLGGSLSGDFRLTVGEDLDLVNSTFNRGLMRLNLYADLNPAGSVRLFMDSWLTSAWDFSADADLSTGNPFDYEDLLPLEVVLREAYVELYGFPHPSIDLRAGRQRIVWGTAEQISVIDNLNPSDLEDFWDFGRRLPSEALKVSWYTSLFTLEAVYLPLFRPAVLPEQMFDMMESATSELSESGFTITDLVTQYALPGADPCDNASLGTRLSASLLGWDLALSYIYGRQDFPTPENITGTVDGALPNVKVDVDSSYPRRHIAGLDFVGELFGLGLWAEAALFYPDHTVVTDTTAIGGGVTEEDVDPYFKASVGLDYTFNSGPYLNIQYVHGLAFENIREELQDYVLAALEWEILDGRLKLGPLAVALEVDDPKEFDESWGLLFNPELSFKPFDSAEFTGGLRWIEGRQGTTFGSNKEQSELYVKGTFSF